MYRRLSHPILLLASSLALAFASASVSAQVQYSYSGCVNSDNETLAAVADPAAKHIVETQLLDSGAVIAYNPTLFPALQPQSRFFLFAHECARHQLRLPVMAKRTVDQAQRADCEALDILLRSDLLQPDQVAGLQGDLVFKTEDWAQLPGPARTIDFAGCTNATPLTPKAAMKLPDAPRSAKWNQCVNGCGATLFSCGRAESCVKRYDSCSAACKD